MCKSLIRGQPRIVGSSLSHFTDDEYLFVNNEGTHEDRYSYKGPHSLIELVKDPSPDAFREEYAVMMPSFDTHSTQVTMKFTLFHQSLCYKRTFCANFTLVRCRRSCICLSVWLHFLTLKSCGISLPLGYHNTVIIYLSGKTRLAFLRYLIKKLLWDPWIR